MGLFEELFEREEREQAQREAEMDEDRLQREANENIKDREAVANAEEYNKLHAKLEKQIADNIKNPKTDFARDNYDNYGIVSPETAALQERLSELESSRAKYLKQAATVQATAQNTQAINLISEELTKKSTTQSSLTAATAATTAEPTTANSSSYAKVAMAGIAIYFLLFR